MVKREWLDVDGVLLLDKPYGLSSNDALQRARRIVGARKGGHGGTLDPLATGLLPIAFGEATKFLNDIVDASKTYQAQIQLGASSNTGDAEGTVIPHGLDVAMALTEPQIADALKNMTGTISQLPPMYSAIKHKGRPLYKYAREGIEIERTPRDITIHSLSLDSWQAPRLNVTVSCSKGTYIRVLASDIAELLGCGAYLLGLRRTVVGRFSVEQAFSLDGLERADEATVAQLDTVDAMLTHLPTAMLSEVQGERFCQGQKLRVADIDMPDVPGSLIADAGDDRIRVYQASRFLGLARVVCTSIAPLRLVVQRATNIKI